MDAELLLEGDLQVEAGAVRVGGLGTSPANCQNCGSSSRAVGPSAAESTAPTRSARMRKPALPSSSRAPWRIFSRSCERSTKTWATANASSSASDGVVPALADLLGPDLGRDVDQQSAAVTLAVDVAGAVEHLLQRFQREGDRLVTRGGVAADGRVDRASVLVLHARRGDEGAIGALRGVARTLWGRVLQLGLRFRAFFERARDGLDRRSAEIIGGALPGPRRSSHGADQLSPQFAKAAP